MLFVGGQLLCARLAHSPRGSALRAHPECHSYLQRAHWQQAERRLGQLASVRVLLGQFSVTRSPIVKFSPPLDKRCLCHFLPHGCRGHRELPHWYPCSVAVARFCPTASSEGKSLGNSRAWCIVSSLPSSAPCCESCSERPLSFSSLVLVPGRALPSQSVFCATGTSHLPTKSTA